MSRSDLQTAQDNLDDDILKFAAFPSLPSEKDNNIFRVVCVNSTTPKDMQNLTYKSIEKEIKENVLFKVSIPTIPSHDRVYGYGEAGNGILFPLNSPIRMYNGTKDDSVGPGQYEIKRDLLRDSKTPIWKLKDDYLKRDIPPIVGPGDYKMEDQWIKNSPNKKHSLGFLSTCSRSKTVRHMLPGPGAYEDPNSIRMQSIKMLKRHSLRYFQRNSASQKVLSFIPADKYLDELKLKAKLNNKLVVMNSLKSPSGRASVGSGDSHHSRRTLSRTQRKLQPTTIKNFQIMLTGRKIPSNVHKCRSGLLTSMKY